MKNNKQIDTLNRSKDGFDKKNYSSYYENESDNDNENSEDYENFSNKNKNNYENNNNSSKSFSSLKNTNIPAKNVLLESENTAPLIFYKSFLNFCTRHCGSWSGK
jgi:hypothetical protein